MCYFGALEREVPNEVSSLGFLKFNIDGAARIKSGPVGIGGVVHNDKGEMLHSLSKHLGITDSNEGEVLSILEALHCYSL